MILNRHRKLLLSAILAAACSGIMASAAGEELSIGQTLYLPVYSYIWHGDVVRKQYPLKTPVSVLVSVRNTNSRTPIKLISAGYRDSRGNLLKQYVDAPLTIAPLATYEMFVEKHEVEGGSGASFLLQWEAAVLANAPVVEALHAEIKGHTTFAFTTKAQSVDIQK